MLMWGPLSRLSLLVLTAIAAVDQRSRCGKQGAKKAMHSELDHIHTTFSRFGNSYQLHLGRVGEIAAWFMHYVSQLSDHLKPEMVPHMMSECQEQFLIRVFLLRLYVPSEEHRSGY